MPTRRANHEGSIFRRKSDGRWMAVISVRDIAGKRRRISRLARSREHARSLLQELKAGHPRMASGPVSLTVSEFLNSWLAATIRISRSENTFASYSAAVRKYIAPTLGRIVLRNLTALHLQEWLTAMDRDDTGERTRQNAFAVLSAALSNAVRLGIATENVALRIDRPRYLQGDPKPFTASETAGIIEETSRHRLAAVFRLALSTGMRQGELFGLRWEDVDFEAGKLRIAQQAVEIGGKVRLTPPKTRHSIRTIPLSPESLNALHERRQNAVREGNAASPLVFVTASGRVIHRSNFGRRVWRNILRKTGLPHRGFHNCRHTAATLMLGAGLPVHVVSRVLGHSKPSITLDIYAHWIRTDDSAVTAAVASVLG